MDSFCHLHVHSHYSMLDGAAKIGALFAEAQRLGMPAVALTDHGNMFGAAEFYRASQGTGVKPLIGVEAYVSPASRHHKKPVYWGQADQRGSDEFGEGGDVSGSGAYCHMTMLAQDATGLRNLFRLSSRASFEGYYRKPRMDRELISEYAQGIIATTGCPSGEVQTRLRLGQREQAMQAASDYRDIFGDRLYLELMDHGLTIERSVRDGLLEIGRALNLPPLATNDSHYVTRDQAGAHAALLCVQTGKTLDDPKRFRFDGDGYYLKSAQEMRAYWDTEVPGAADNTLVIAERVGSYDEVFATVNRKPRFPLECGDTEDAALRREVDRGAVIRFPDGLPDGYRERLDTELAVISQMGFSGYFLVVADLVNWALSRGVLCRGRGSAAGCLAVYMLRITDLDPIEHDLYFERFINPDRVSPPDIDIDVPDYHRAELVNYLTERWGADKVAQVITFSTIKTKAAIKDATHVLGHPFAAGERLTKALPRTIYAEDIPLSGVFDPQHSRYADAEEFRQLTESDPQAAEIVATAQGMEGLIRQAGVHACGVFLSSEPMLDVLPMWMRQTDNAIITGWDWSTCEDLGMLKLDVLGSATISVIASTVEAVQAIHGISIDLSILLLDDPIVYEMLSRGDALGVFQLDSAGMRDLLRRVKPSCFEDICAATALYRPGPMGMGTHHEYADRKNGRSPVTPIHPELAEPLADALAGTFGLCVYQEDVMTIARKLAGYTLAQADLLRRAMGKKKKSILDGEFVRFRDGMAANGYSTEATQALWDVMVPFSSYAFVRSHAASYGLVSYWTAWLKAHYPAEFMAARLTSISDNKDKSAIYLAECRRLGIRVLPPDVNDSGLRFTAMAGDIRFGLGAIKGVGEQVVRSVVATRERAGRFGSFEDFLGKVDATCCNKGIIAALIRAGAFDSLGHTRRALDEVHADAIDTAVTVKRHELRGEVDLFADTEDQALSGLVPELPEWPRKHLLALERDVLGLSVSGHPLDGAEHVLRRHAPQPIAVLVHEAPAEGGITVAGVITKVERKPGKKGSWAIVTLEDLDTSVEVRFFTRAYAELSEVLTVDAVVAVRGEVTWRDDRMSVAGQEVTVLDITATESEPAPVAPFVLRVDPQRLDLEAVTALRAVLLAHRGEVPVRVIMAYRGTNVTFALDDYPVAVSEVLTGKLVSLGGISV